MEKKIELPKFYEEKQYTSKQVTLAKYSRDGKVLATVNLDYSLSIWDSQDILVETYLQTIFFPKVNGRSNSYHAVYLDWSANSKQLYYIVDCSGFLIDVYGPKKIYRNFSFDQVLNSFSCHPLENHLCLVTCLDKLIVLNINTDSHTIKLNYRELTKSENSKRGSIPSYAQYTGIDGLIILWLNGTLFLVDDSGHIMKSYTMKQTQPMQQRIRIDNERRICIVVCRNELITLSLPDFDVISSYRDSVNDSPWRAIDYQCSNQLILAIPENYVVDGPVFYLLTSEGELEVSICRDPKQHLIWGLWHPSGKTILLCTEQGDLILFRKEERGFKWHGPMYPFNFTYIKRNEQGPQDVDKDFQKLFFPGIIDKEKTDMNEHVIDIMEGAKPRQIPFLVDLLPEDEERILLYNDSLLPPLFDDLYGYR